MPKRDVWLVRMPWERFVIPEHPNYCVYFGNRPTRLSDGMWPRGDDFEWNGVPTELIVDNGIYLKPGGGPVRIEMRIVEDEPCESG